MNAVTAWLRWLTKDSLVSSSKEDLDDLKRDKDKDKDKGKGKAKAVDEEPEEELVPPNSTERECLERMRDLGFEPDELELFSDICRDAPAIRSRPAPLEILFRTAKRLDLPLDRLRTESKQDWFTQLTRYNWVTAYYIKMGLFSHWKLVLATDTDVILQIELKAYVFTDKLAVYFQDTIRSLNADGVADIDKIIIPCLTVNNAVSEEELKAIRRLSRRVPFAELFGAVMLDREAFKKYDYFKNNCQHYIKRIFNGVIRPYITNDDAELFQRTIVAQREALMRDQPRASPGSSVGSSVPASLAGPGAEPERLGLEEWR